MALPFALVAGTVAASFLSSVVVVVREDDAVAVFDRAVEPFGEPFAAHASTPPEPASFEPTWLGAGVHFISPWREAARVSKTVERMSIVTLNPVLTDGSSCPAQVRVVYTTPDAPAAIQWRKDQGVDLSDTLFGAVAHTPLPAAAETALSGAMAKADGAGAEAALRAAMKREARRLSKAAAKDGSRLVRLELTALGCADEVTMDYVAAAPRRAAPAAAARPKPRGEAPAARRAYGPARPFLSSSFRPSHADLDAERAETMMRVALAAPIEAQTQEGARVVLTGLAAHFAITDSRRFDDAYMSGAAGEAHAKRALRLLLEQAARVTLSEVRASEIETLDLRRRMMGPRGALQKPTNRLHAGIAAIALDLSEAEYRVVK
ncbi:MAG: hypothetical protein AAGM38_06735 [Pseudomonadota bacterium]